jgi:hypothetical protein
MSTSNVSKLPREYRIPASQDYVRNIKLPHWPNLTDIHAFVRIRDFVNGAIPDKINPRSHEGIKGGRVPQAITDSLDNNPKAFHLLNRGCLILAKKAWYDNNSKTLHFILESEDEHGMVDGATTDRVLENLKNEAAIADFDRLKEDEIPETFKESYLYLEILAGDMENGMRIELADARNTSAQVKEFSLEDLGHGFDWLKDVLEKSELAGLVRYRENEPKPVDVRTILALLTLFHPNWDNAKEPKEPIVAYSGKARVIDLYRDEEWRDNYEKLSPVVVDIIKLYDYVHVNFQEQYMRAYGPSAKLGRRTEIDYRDPQKKQRPKILPLTNQSTRYPVPDGWLYPLLASFRMLLVWPKGAKGEVKWIIDPFSYFDKYGHELVQDIVEQSEELGHNPNATGKSGMLWRALRAKVENRLLKSQHPSGHSRE